MQDISEIIMSAKSDPYVMEMARANTDEFIAWLENKRNNSNFIQTQTYNHQEFPAEHVGEDMPRKHICSDVGVQPVSCELPQREIKGKTTLIWDVLIFFMTNPESMIRDIVPHFPGPNKNSIRGTVRSLYQKNCIYVTWANGNFYKYSISDVAKQLIKEDANG